MTFKAFGPAHFVMLGVIVGLCGVIFRVGQRVNGSQRLWMGRTLGLFLLGYVLAANIPNWQARGLSWHEKVPLHLCSWVLVACLIALFRPHPLAFEIAYFWGLTGTLQALITPDLRAGFPAWPFFKFFWGHGGVFFAIVFLMSAYGFRPRRGSVLRMFLAINVYAAMVGMFDLLFHENYGYLCHAPSQPSLIDHLGPWPWYILAMELIALTTFWLLDLPWERRRERLESRGV